LNGGRLTFDSDASKSVINILKPRVTKKEYKTKSDVFCQKEEKQIMVKLKNFYKNTNLILHIFIKASMFFF